MIEVRYNVFVEHERATIDEKICSVWISSADERISYDVVYNILIDVFQDSQMIFRATGDPDNLKDMLEFITNCNPIYFEAEIKKILFIEILKNFSEVHAEISDKATLKNVLDAYSWTNTVTEQRYLHVLKEGQTDNVFNILKENVYDDRSHLALLWPHLDCMVKNEPEAENWSTLILIFREKYSDRIKEVVSRFNSQ